MKVPDLGKARLDELAVLVDVSEAGSLSAAARRLGVPKSTVGRAIGRLEEDFGVALVRRLPGPALTEQGRVLAELAAPHVSALREVSTALGRDKAEIYGRIRITSPSDLAAFVLAPLVTAFVARHPRVHVEVDSSLHLVDLVNEGFDFALRVARKTLKPSALIAKKLARLDLSLYAGSSYVARRGTPRRIEDLESHDHVLVERATDQRVLELEGPKGPTSTPIGGRLLTNDFAFAREAIINGAGLGPLPWFLASADLASGRLVRILPDHRFAGTTAHLVHAPAKPLAPKIAAFKAFVLENAPRLLVAPP